MMRLPRTVVVFGVALLLALSAACPKKEEESRTITITIWNDGDSPVKFFLEGELPSNAPFIDPEESYKTYFLAKSIGHRVSIYVAREDDSVISTNCGVTQTSWDSQSAVVRWDGSALHCTSW